MNDQMTLDEQMAIDPRTKARAEDPWTAHNAAHAVAKMGKAKNQRWLLLDAFARWPDGLTSEEAASHAERVSLRSEYSTRCSELQRLELIVPTGEKRNGWAGVARDVYRITDRGVEVFHGQRTTYEWEPS